MDDATLTLESAMDVLVRARDFSDPASKVMLRGLRRSDQLVSILRGMYASAGTWERLGERGRHFVVMAAVQASRGSTLRFSHWSALAAWGLPTIGRLPDDAHIVVPAASGGRSDERLVRHCTDDPMPIATVRGFQVTSLARTVIDMTRVVDFATAVAIGDAAMAGRTEGGIRTTPHELASMLPAPGRRGAGRARAAIENLDGRSESVGESISRAAMLRAGLPKPELQHEFRDRSGVMRVDFWWPRFNLIGEFDGLGKYLRPELTLDRDPGRIVVEEKLREDRLRALGPRVARWGWREARSPTELRAKLAPYFRERHPW